ncbi:hypothetical protein D3C71_1433960 [compost metagenome]
MRGSLHRLWPQGDSFAYRHGCQNAREVLGFRQSRRGVAKALEGALALVVEGRIVITRGPEHGRFSQFVQGHLGSFCRRVGNRQHDHHGFLAHSLYRQVGGRGGDVAGNRDIELVTANQLDQMFG